MRQGLQAASPDLREARRKKVFLPVAIETVIGPHRAHILDISQSGARMHIDAAVACGETVVLHCGAIDISSQVSWRRDLFCGVRFAQQLSGEQVNALVTAKSDT
ncbi:MAG TPA: PilZ domain-containing protein [Sphingobium sp.]